MNCRTENGMGKSPALLSWNGDSLDRNLLQCLNEEFPERLDG